MPDNYNAGSEDNYSDSSPTAPASTEEETPQEEGKPEEESDSPRGLLPKSILAGKDFKPGEEIVLKIVAIHDDEVEVEYATEKGSKGKEGYGEETASAGDSEMAGLME